MTPKLDASVRQTVPEFRAERAAPAEERRTSAAATRISGEKGRESDVRKVEGNKGIISNHNERQTKPQGNQPRFEDELTKTESAETATSIAEIRPADGTGRGADKLAGEGAHPAVMLESGKPSAKAVIEIDLTAVQTLDLTGAVAETVAIGETDAAIPALEAGAVDEQPDIDAIGLPLDEQIEPATGDMLAEAATDQPASMNASANDVPAVDGPAVDVPSADATAVSAPVSFSVAPPAAPVTDPAAEQIDLPTPVRTIGLEPAGSSGKTIEAAQLTGQPVDGAMLAETADAGFEAPARPENPSFHNVLSRQTDLLRPAIPSEVAPPLPPSLPVVVAPLGTVPIEIGLKAMAGLSRFEIRLDPADLGRIDVTLDIGEDGTVRTQMVVDKVETLHLLQRDARTLERAFEQAGLKASDQGVDLSLRDPGQQNQNSRDQSAPWRPSPRDGAGNISPGNTTLPDITNQPVPSRIWRGAAGIDVRV